MRRIDTVILHHSGRHDTPESIKQLHVEERGWDDIGYHYLIDRDGNIIPCRDEGVQGAHAKGHNAHSVGVCLLGDKDSEGVPELQMGSLIWVIKDLCKRYEGAKVLGHRELKGVKKSCPGRNVDMDKVRSLVQQSGSPPKGSAD